MREGKLCLLKQLYNSLLTFPGVLHLLYSLWGVPRFTFVRDNQPGLNWCLELTVTAFLIQKPKIVCASCLSF